MKSFIFASLFLAVVCFEANVASAYFTTNQDALLLGDGGALFTVAYEFGSDRYAYQMPLMAEHGTSSSSTTLSLGYEIVDKNGDVVTTGNAVGLVLSSAPLINGEYVIDRGTVKPLMLMVIYDAGQGSAEAVSGLRLRVTSLPFVMTDAAGIETAGQLNPSELEYYQTPVVGKR